MQLYQYQFLKRHDFVRVEKPSKVLIVASTGRSGSHQSGNNGYEGKNSL